MNYFKLINPSILSICISLLSANIQAQQKFKNEGNPLVKHMYTADPSAHVFNDKIYIYTSHDENNSTYFDMLDWHVFSSENLQDWEDHGPILSIADLKWATKWAWAPDCIEREGKYYFYYPVERTKIGVAVSDSPTGPFVDTLQKPLIDNTDQVEKIGPEPIDPALLIEDEQAYMYFGCRELRAVKLKDNMMEVDGDILNIKINGIEDDKENFGGFYGEGPWVFNRNDLFYFMYSNGWGKESTLVYATSKNPLGPFDFKGEVMEPVNSWTSHGSIVEFKGKWYIFYHDMTLSGNNYQRSICFNEITFDEKGNINKLKIEN
jgi:arabinoxylan arabinofuranohydrolase